MEVPLASSDWTKSDTSTYRKLLNAPGARWRRHRMELESECGVILSFMPGAVAKKRRPRTLRTSEPSVQLVRRIRESDASVLAWFSLRAGWQFDAGPDADARSVIALDHRGVSWQFDAGPGYWAPNSHLPVEDVRTAAAWYGHLFEALGFGRVIQMTSRSWCVDVISTFWSARVLPRAAWPLAPMGVGVPHCWEHCTGQRMCRDRREFEATLGRLASLGTTARVDDRFATMSDPFGYQWYVSLVDPVGQA